MGAGGSRSRLPAQPRGPPPCALAPPLPPPLGCRRQPQLRSARLFPPAAGGSRSRRRRTQASRATLCQARSLTQRFGPIPTGPESFTDEETEAQKELPVPHPWPEVRAPVQPPTQVDWPLGTGLLSGLGRPLPKYLHLNQLFWKHSCSSGTLTMRYGLDWKVLGISSHAVS